VARPAFERDNILTPEERLASARKCLRLLSPAIGGMGEKEAEFVDDMENKVDRFGVSERQLAWLRDLVEKYG
jgi:hypothetical protein